MFYNIIIIIIIKLFYHGICSTILLLLLLLLLFWSPLCKAGSEDTLSVQRPQPHTSNPWKEEKDKTVGDKKERADQANRKALALLLKPASPTPSNTGH